MNGESHWMKRAPGRSSLVIALAAFSFAMVSGSVLADKWNRWGRGERIRGSGKMATEMRDVSGFTAIRVNNSTDIDITIGEKFSVELEAEDNLLEIIETEVVRGELRITTADGYNVWSRRGSRLTITMPSLDGIKISGSSDLRAQGISGDEFTIEINGSGDIELSGKAEEVEIEIRGSGDIDARDFHATNVEIDIRGSGDVKISVEEQLWVNISGSGDITYYGNPKVKKRIRGSGDLSQRSARRAGK